MWALGRPQIRPRSASHHGALEQKNNWLNLPSSPAQATGLVAATRGVGDEKGLQPAPALQVQVLGRPHRARLAHGPPPWASVRIRGREEERALRPAQK